MTKLIQNMLLNPHLYAREIIFKNVKNYIQFWPNNPHD